MARGPGKNDMIVWKGKWQRKKKRAVCPDSRSQREGARGSRAGWLHEGELPFPDPAFFGVSGTVLGGMEQSGLISWRTYPQYHVFKRGRELAVAVAMGMSICEVVECV